MKSVIKKVRMKGPRYDFTISLWSFFKAWSVAVPKVTAIDWKY
jgi:hypothetical protein